MRRVGFISWATEAGGLQTNSAESYVDYLTAVESDYGVELDTDWRASQLKHTRSLLEGDASLNVNTQRNRLSALNKYKAFCSATG